MKRSHKVVMAVAITALVVAGLLVYLFPLPQSQSGMFSGGTSNDQGESFNFSMNASQTWQTSWSPQAAWYVGGVKRTETTYGYGISVSGVNLSPGSVHFKVQMKGTKGTSESVRWTSDITGKTAPYTDTYSSSAEPIDDLSTALSFSTTNGSQNTVVFKCFAEFWATGAITGTQLYVNTTTWQSFSSNSLTYVAVQGFESRLSPSAVLWEVGSGSTGVELYAYDDTSYAPGSCAFDDFFYYWYARVRFTFENIPSSATYIKAAINYKPDDSNFLDKEPLTQETANDIFILSTGGVYNHVYEFGARSAGTWYTETTNWLSASTYRYSDGHVYVAFSWYQADAGGNNPPNVYIDYVWLYYQAAASWVDLLTMSTTMLAFVALAFAVTIVYIRRKRGR